MENLFYLAGLIIETRINTYGRTRLADSEVVYLMKMSRATARRLRSLLTEDIDARPEGLITQSVSVRDSPEIPTNLVGTLAHLRHLEDRRLKEFDALLAFRAMSDPWC